MAIKLENYKKIRDHLFKLLNPVCVHCGATEELELDHIIPNGYLQSGVSRSQRVWDWIESFDKGNLQVLCSECNKIKGDRIPEIIRKKNFVYSRYCDKLTKCIDCRSFQRCKKKRKVSVCQT